MDHFMVTLLGDHQLSHFGHKDGGANLLIISHFQLQLSYYERVRQKYIAPNWYIYLMAHQTGVFKVSLNVPVIILPPGFLGYWPKVCETGRFNL